MNFNDSLMRQVERCDDNDLHLCEVGPFQIGVQQDDN